MSPYAQAVAIEIQQLQKIGAAPLGAVGEIARGRFDEVLAALEADSVSTSDAADAILDLCGRAGHP